MASIERGDYAVLSLEGKKKALIKVTHEATADGSMFRGVVVDHTAARKETRQQYSFEPADILANLGPNPSLGSVYGIKSEPFRRMVQHPLWGDIFLFRTIDPREEAMTLQHMTKVGQNLKQLGVFPYRKETQIHIRAAQGKHPGSYTYDSKGHDIITLKVASFDHENMDYYLSHEWGHGMWFTMMPPAYRAQWIKLYTKNTEKRITGSQRIQSLMREFIESGMTVREFGKSLDETDKLVFTEILLAIRKMYSMEPRHINELREVSAESIVGIWPKNAIELPQHNILVSDYANKNPDEFWCEAFSFWFIGKQIPGGLAAAVQKTIAACKFSEGVTGMGEQKQAA